MAAYAELQSRTIWQLVHTMDSIASSLRARNSAAFVYTPSNASSLRDLDFKLELIKVSNSFLDAPGISDANTAVASSCK